MIERQSAEWKSNEPHLWHWGDWFIAEDIDGFYLIVSSGVQYGPFDTFEAVKAHAENVRGD